MIKFKLKEFSKQKSSVNSVSDAIDHNFIPGFYGNIFKLAEFTEALENDRDASHWIGKIKGDYLGNILGWNKIKPIDLFILVADIKNKNELKFIKNKKDYLDILKKYKNLFESDLEFTETVLGWARTIGRSRRYEENAVRKLPDLKDISKRVKELYRFIAFCVSGQLDVYKNELWDIYGKHLDFNSQKAIEDPEKIVEIIKISISKYKSTYGHKIKIKSFSMTSKFIDRINFRPIEYLPWTSENIKIYKSQENLLRHARVGSKVSGFLAIDKNSKNLIGYAAWEDDFLIAFEISKNYRGKGFGKKLLEKSINEGIRKLSVSKNNFPAINLYKYFGFKPYKESEKMIFMKLDGQK